MPEAAICLHDGDVPSTCEELAQTGTPLFCMLPAGHDEPWHYDEVDDVTWAKGRHLPGEAASRG